MPDQDQKSQEHGHGLEVHAHTHEHQHTHEHEHSHGEGGHHTHEHIHSHAHEHVHDHQPGHEQGHDEHNIDGQHAHQGLDEHHHHPNMEWSQKPMDFKEKAKIKMEHMIRHDQDHLTEYQGFAQQLNDAGLAESAEAIKEMAAYLAKGVDCLQKALNAMPEAAKRP